MQKVANKSTKVLSRMFFGLVVIQFFSHVSGNIGKTVGGIVIGNFLDTNSLVAYGLASPVFSLVFSLARLVSAGGQIICGRLMGAGNLKKMDGVFTVSIVTILVIGVLLSLGFGIFAEQVAVVLGATGSVIEATRDYLIPTAFGIVPMMLIPVLFSYLHLENDSKFAIIVDLVCTVFTTILYLLNVNLFKSGIFGIGVANTVSKYLVVLVLIIRFIKSKSLTKLDFKQFNFKMIGLIFFLGLPAAFSNMLFSARGITINNLAYVIGGNDFLSSLTILNSLSGVIFAPNLAVSSAVIMMISLLVGERDFDALANFCRYLSRAFLVFGAIHIIIILLLTRPLVSSFGATGVIYTLAVELISIYALSTLPNLYAIVCSALNQSFGRVWFVNLMNLFNYFLLPIGFILVTKGFLGYKAVCFCYVFAETMTVILYGIRAWFAKKKVSIKTKDLINIPEDMEPEYKEVWSIEKYDDVSLVSEELIAFCEKSGLDKKSSMYCGLCLEEMAVNILENGMQNKHKDDLTIDVFAIYENDNVTVRLRDNAPYYDPKTRLTRFDPEDPTKNIGMRIVSNLAKEMDYKSTFGTNVFTFKL